jgi:putative IMPACT (imprinted ancient) family translation regulator
VPSHVTPLDTVIRGIPPLALSLIHYLFQSTFESKKSIFLNIFEKTASGQQSSVVGHEVPDENMASNVQLHWSFLAGKSAPAKH